MLSLVCYATAAYIGSLDQSKQQILGRVPASTNHMTHALQDLAKNVGRDDWTSIEDVDVALRQRHLSKAIDQAVFDDLCATAPNIRFKALALSSSIPHAGDWLNVVPSTALGLHLFDWEYVLAGVTNGVRGDSMPSV